MDSDRSTTTTTLAVKPNLAGKDNPAAVPVTDAPPPPPSFSVTTRFVPLFFSLNGNIQLYLVFLAVVQHQFNDDKLSPFMTHRMLMIMSIVAMCLALVIGIIIVPLKYWAKSMKELHFRFLEGICVMSGYLANFSLLMVYIVPGNRNWIGYLVLGIILAITVPYLYAINLCFDEKDFRKTLACSHENTYISQWVMVALYPVVFVVLTFFCAPESIKRIRLWVVGVNYGPVAAYNGIVCLKSMYDKKYSSSLKAPLIQQDSDNLKAPLIQQDSGKTIP